MPLQGLAKLLEECGEVQQVAGKVLAYGLGPHPDGTESLKRRLEDELADVSAASVFVAHTMNLDRERMEARAEAKYDQYVKWHADPDNASGRKAIRKAVRPSQGRKGEGK